MQKPEETEVDRYLPEDPDKMDLFGLVVGRNEDSRPGKVVYPNGNYKYPPNLRLKGDDRKVEEPLGPAVHRYCEQFRNKVVFRFHGLSGSGFAGSGGVFRRMY